MPASLEHRRERQPVLMRCGRLPFASPMPPIRWSPPKPPSAEGVDLRQVEYIPGKIGRRQSQTPTVRPRPLFTGSPAEPHVRVVDERHQSADHKKQRGRPSLAEPLPFRDQNSAFSSLLDAALSGHNASGIVCIIWLLVKPRPGCLHPSKPGGLTREHSTRAGPEGAA
jgi:hypothetical protein